MSASIYGPGKPWKHRLLNYRRTGHPLLDLRAHVHRIIHGHYDAANNPSVRHKG